MPDSRHSHLLLTCGQQMKDRLHSQGQEDLLEAGDEMANLYPIEDIPYLPQGGVCRPWAWNLD